MSDFMDMAYPIMLPVVFFSSLLYMFIVDFPLASGYGDNGARKHIFLAVLAALACAAGWMLAVVFGVIYGGALLVRALGIYIAAALDWPNAHTNNDDNSDLVQLPSMPGAHIRPWRPRSASEEEVAARAQRYLDYLSADLECPNCGGEADNGHDREDPPNAYFCTTCDPPY